MERIRALVGWRRLAARAALLTATALGAVLLLPLYLLTRSIGTFAGKTVWMVLRLTAVSAAELRSSDPRAPVLYLRPFAEDNILRTEEGWEPVTAERILGSIFDEIGPPIAIGRPGDVAPLAGVACVAPSDEWQTYINDTLREAALVVIQAGDSEGLSLELDMVRQVASPRRVLVSFVSWQQVSKHDKYARYADFKTVARERLRIAPPKSLGPDVFWAFDEEWQLERIPARPRHWALIGQWSNNHEGIREVLRPVLAARGMHVRWHRTILAAFCYSLMWFLLVVVLANIVAM